MQRCSKFHSFFLVNINFEMPHCKDTILKIRNKYSQKRNCLPQPQFPHSCVSERFIYSHYLSALTMWTDPGNIYIVTDT